MEIYDLYSRQIVQFRPSTGGGASALQGFARNVVLARLCEGRRPCRALQGASGLQGFAQVLRGASGLQDFAKGVGLAGLCGRRRAWRASARGVGLAGLCEGRRACRALQGASAL